jgi:hypothetical protein
MADVTRIKVMRTFVLATLLLVATTAQSATTRDNDSSCDIGVFPAATLLLPYFEVDITSTAGASTSTIFSVTNVSPYPQIAHVTLWTDWGFPVLTFSIFLTGYDVEPISLFDVIARGRIGNGTGTNSPNGGNNPNPASRPFTNLANPNFQSDVSVACQTLPGVIPGSLAADVRAALTVGRSTGATVSCRNTDGTEAQIGGNHGANLAIGYATIDVVSSCVPRLAADEQYFTRDLLYDNVLTGDYQQVLNRGDGVGTSMVHIRAVPEGGGAGSVPSDLSPLPYTFYDRYTPPSGDRRIDRRQPLPSAFAARYISGEAFDTSLQIWREGIVGRDASCSDFRQNGTIRRSEIVRFDERENATTSVVSIPENPFATSTAAATRLPINSQSIPAAPAGASGGWLYINLNNGGSAAYSGSRNVSQNWATVRLSTTSGHFVETDATQLGNGCSPAFQATANRIAPSGGAVVCPPSLTPTNGDAAACTGTNLNP